MSIRVSASILDCDFRRLEQELNAVVNAGADSIHLDIMDGHFVPNLSYGTPIARAVRNTVKVPVYSHLMVLAPEKMIARFAPYSDIIIFHIEATTEPEKCLSEIRQAGCQPGISLNPDTPLDNLLPWLSRIADVLIMSVQPGFGGQQFIPESLNRIARLCQWRAEKNLKFTISVDGGISPANSAQVIQAGADLLVAGSTIFKSADYQTTIRALKCLTF
jgi:ribulose-phosphate 3-epimerase|uniref:Ribulose-phosphate 3-epimerase n=1 Tax=candidate division WOR-3 bacterium TaxID=2052148 RepID=A0A7V3PTY3_UNCW3